jgi:hypothetical protein
MLEVGEDMQRSGYKMREIWMAMIAAYDQPAPPAPPPPPPSRVVCSACGPLVDGRHRLWVCRVVGWLTK